MKMSVKKAQEKDESFLEQFAKIVHLQLTLQFHSFSPDNIVLEEFGQSTAT